MEKHYKCDRPKPKTIPISMRAEKFKSQMRDCVALALLEVLQRAH
jgi:hypothetical protein